MSALVVFVVLLGVVGLAVYFSIKNDGEKAAHEVTPDTFAPSAEFQDDSSRASKLGLAAGWYPNAEGDAEIYYDGEAWGESRPRQ